MHLMLTFFESGLLLMKKELLDIHNILYTTYLLPSVPLVTKALELGVDNLFSKLHLTLQNTFLKLTSKSVKLFY